MLPEEWFKRYGLLADIGTIAESSLRFTSAQASILDVLLETQSDIQFDAAFEKIRQNLRQFDGVVAIDSPSGFHGELRPYQREGLGWLHYLYRFGFGGILADDMGLGKTIQVLAFLQRRRACRQTKGPSLAVVPRSLVFNWIQEAARFTPAIFGVLDYTGPSRHVLREIFVEYDLIITTYGTVRTDITELTSFKFDYVILDEAQAIKNADSQSAKAADSCGVGVSSQLAVRRSESFGRTLVNIEFLNPGMLGSDTIFKKYVGASTTLNEMDRALLAKVLRLFLLVALNSKW